MPQAAGKKGDETWCSKSARPSFRRFLRLAAIFIRSKLHLRHRLDGGAKEAIDGLGRIEDFRNILFEDHAEHFSLWHERREAIRFGLRVIELVLGGHIGPVNAAGSLLHIFAVRFGSVLVR